MPKEYTLIGGNGTQISPLEVTEDGDYVAGDSRAFNPVIVRTGGGGSSLPPITTADNHKVLAVGPDMNATPTSEVIVPEQESTYVVDDAEGTLSDVDVSKFVRGGLVRVTVNGDEYLTLAYGEGEMSGFAVATSIGYIDCWTNDGTDLSWDITPAPDTDTTITIKAEAVDYPLSAQWTDKVWKYVFSGHTETYADGRYTVELDEPTLAAEAHGLYLCAFLIEDSNGYIHFLANPTTAGAIEGISVSFDSFTEIPNLRVSVLTFENNQWYFKDKVLALGTIRITVSYSQATGYYIAQTEPLGLDFSALWNLAVYPRWIPMCLHTNMGPGNSREYYPLMGARYDESDSEIYFAGPHNNNGTIVMRHFIVKASGVTFTDTALGS